MWAPHADWSSSPRCSSRLLDGADVVGIQGLTQPYLAPATAGGGTVRQSSLASRQPLPRGPRASAPSFPNCSPRSPANRTPPSPTFARLLGGWTPRNPSATTNPCGDINHACDPPGPRKQARHREHSGLGAAATLGNPQIMLFGSLCVIWGVRWCLPKASRSLSYMSRVQGMGNCLSEFILRRGPRCSWLGALHAATTGKNLRPASP